MKLWGGRFEKETDSLVEEFNASISFDCRLFHYDILGSIAHVKMLAKCKIISQDERDLIITGLKEVEVAIIKGEVTYDPSLEDIHTLIEKTLIDRIGKTGKKLHTARSRNDQVATDLRLYLRDNVKEICSLILIFLQLLLDMADQYKETVFPGYTHLQRAQPVTFGHHLLAYYYKLKRDYERFQDNIKRINILPLGSGAMAGTSFNIDREWVAEELGFKKICLNSIDGVSDRDFLIEFLSIAATLMMHLSRFSEEIILWSSAEFDFIELADAYTTGSSIMPQKKNPDVAELIRGKTGRVYGHLIQLLTVLKGLPLSYNKDMQEDKEGVFDTVDTLKIVLRLYPGMLQTMTVKKTKMKEAAERGFLNATELANYLVRKGVPFREAHEIVGRAVLHALEKGKELQKFTLEEWRNLFPEKKSLFTANLMSDLEIKNCITASCSAGGPAPEEAKKIIDQETKWLKNTPGFYNSFQK